MDRANVESAADAKNTRELSSLACFPMSCVLLSVELRMCALGSGIFVTNGRYTVAVTAAAHAGEHAKVHARRAGRKWSSLTDARIETIEADIAATILNGTFQSGAGTCFGAGGRCGQQSKCQRCHCADSDQKLHRAELRSFITHCIFTDHCGSPRSCTCTFRRFALVLDICPKQGTI